MIILLADTLHQGKHYFRRLFPNEPFCSRRVLIATQPYHVVGMRGYEAIMVGTFPTWGRKSSDLLQAVLAGGVDPVQGPVC